MFNDADFKLDGICQFFLQLVLGRFAPFEHEEGGRGDGEAGGDLEHLVNSFVCFFASCKEGDSVVTGFS